MKNIFSLLFILFIIQLPTFAQDIIITQKNDTINCKIKEVTEDKTIYKTFASFQYQSKTSSNSSIKNRIYNFHSQTIEDKDVLKSLHSHYMVNRDFDTIYCNLIQIRKSYIAYSEIINGKEIIKGIPRYQIKKIHNLKNPEKGSNGSFEFNLHGGYSSRLVKRPSTSNSGEADLIDGIYSGVYIRGTANYYINNQWGLGVLYSHFGTSGIGSLSVQISETEYEILPTSLDVSINYVALRASYIFYPDESNYRIGFNVNIGEVFYTEEGKINGIYYSGSGTDFGLGFGADFAYYFIKNVGFSINLNLIASAMDELNITLGEESDLIKLEGEDQMNLNQVQLGAGLVIKL